MVLFTFTFERFFSWFTNWKRKANTKVGHFYKKLLTGKIIFSGFSIILAYYALI